MMRAAALLLALCAGLAGLPARAAAPGPAEGIVAGMSEHQIAITASFNGSDLLVFGAVKRESPIPEGKPLQVIVTLQGPPNPVDVSRKGHVFGIWINTQKVEITAAPSFYAVATSGPLRDVVSHTDDLRYRISIPTAIRSVGTAAQVSDPQAFVNALIRIRKEEGLYVLDEGAVTVEQSTLFRAKLSLPANLTEGLYTAHIYLTRDGNVIAQHQSQIRVRKTGIERFLYRLAQDQPAIYGLLSLVIAIAAGWIASAAFRMVKR